MTLPDKALFTTSEACQVLAVSQASVRRLIAEGQLRKLYPRPRAMRITRGRLAAHLIQSAIPGAVRAATAQSSAAQTQARASVQAEARQQKKKRLLEKWGLRG